MNNSNIFFGPLIIYSHCCLFNCLHTHSVHPKLWHPLPEPASVLQIATILKLFDNFAPAFLLSLSLFFSAVVASRISSHLLYTFTCCLGFSFCSFVL